MKMVYTQPVKVGDVLQVTIVNLGEKGDGIARFKDFVIVVPGCNIDETLKVKVKKVFPKWALGEPLLV